MTVPTYPLNDLDRTNKLVGLLGSFWSDHYAGSDLVRQLAQAVGEVGQENFSRYREAADAIARTTIPPLERRQWSYWPLRSSEVKAGPFRYQDAPPVPYGTGKVYGGSANSELTVATLPRDLVGSCLIYNRILEPSRSLQDGLDYWVDGQSGTMTFRHNPFDDPLWARDQDGDDTILHLWLWWSDYDRGRIYERYGYVLGAREFGVSSAAYRDVVDGLFRCIIGGPSVENVQRVLTASCGIPLAAEPDVVESILVDRDLLHVATSRRLYSFAGDALPVVAPGDQVAAGQELTDALRFDEFNRGQVPPGVGGLTLGRNFITIPGTGEIGFTNELLPVTVTNLEGKSKVEVPLRGHPLDVEAFWDETHRRGVASGRTLANVLDQRPNPTGEPTAEDLPESLNPLELICDSVLRGNAFLVRIKTASIAPGAAGIGNLPRLEFLLASETAMIVMFELPALSSSGGKIETDVPTSDLGAEPLSVDLVPGWLVERSDAWTTAPSCLSV